MTVTVHRGRAEGMLAAPPSKSAAHRLLICAGLSRGDSIIRGVSASQDILATIDCLQALGAECRLSGGTVHVRGADILHTGTDAILRCRESGSTMRFFIPIALACGRSVRLEGSRTLLSRPMDVYADICRQRGLTFEQTQESITVKGPLSAGEFKIRGDISSQFISGLLFALPILGADSVIDIIPPMESRLYADMTAEALAQFGVKVRRPAEYRLEIPGNQTYLSRDLTVEGDYSNAAFFYALNSLGSDIDITGLDPDSLQPDKVCVKLFEELDKPLPQIDIRECPDLGPILMAAAAAKHGAVFTGTKRLRIKESDRARAMADELEKFGAKVQVGQDRVQVRAEAFHRPDTALDGHNDHRVVMSLAVLLTLTGGAIKGAQAVSKSFPDFFDKLNGLGIRTEQHDDN